MVANARVGFAKFQVYEEGGRLVCFHHSDVKDVFESLKGQNSLHEFLKQPAESPQLKKYTFYCFMSLLLGKAINSW